MPATLHGDQLKAGVLGKNLGRLVPVGTQAVLEDDARPKFLPGDRAQQTHSQRLDVVFD
jgi:hypothetical protein